MSFAFVFGLILALLLITALWIGLNLATAIVEPLGSVISVAEQVRDGNLSERVPEGLEVDEIARLGLSFNNMLDELTRSREQLVQANMQIDRRREFTEAVLSGVSSGVIGLDKDRKVTLPNMTACQLLQRAETDLIGNRLEEVVPEFASLIASGASRRRKFVEEQIILTGEEAVDASRKDRHREGRRPCHRICRDIRRRDGPSCRAAQGGLVGYRPADRA